MSERNRGHRQGVIETTTKRTDHKRFGRTPGLCRQKRQFAIDLVLVHRMTLTWHVQQIGLEPLTRVEITDP